MADISQINLPDGSSFNVKDATARRDKADRVPEPAEYDSTATYAPGDFCTHEGDIYQATNNATGTWHPGSWILCTPQQDYLHSINPNGNGTFSLNRKMGTTIGTFSFAAGHEVTATGTASHAEGYGTTASSVNSHAEGHRTTASGMYGSHSEGYVTTASGNYSHAEGNYTIANHKSQHVFGEYNIEDPSTADATRRGNYVEIVGNGSISGGEATRSNARTLDWDGNEVLAGRLKVNGTEDVPIVYEVTQSQYDTLKQAGTLVHNALYVITDAQNLNATASDIEYSSGVSVYNKINRMDTLDYYQVPTAVADNATAQIPAAVWAHRLIIINVRRYGYFGSMFVRKQNIVEGQLGASCCIYVSSSPKYFKVNESGLFTALSNFGTDGQWVDFIGIF